MWMTYYREVLLSLLLSYSIVFVASQLDISFDSRLLCSFLHHLSSIITNHFTSLSITTSTFHSNKHTIEFDISDSP